MGALVATIGRSQINAGLPHLSAATKSGLANALGSGATIGGHASPHVVSVVQSAFVSALGTGLLIGAAVTFMAAIVAWFLIEQRPRAVKPEIVSVAPAIEPELTLAA